MGLVGPGWGPVVGAIGSRHGPPPGFGDRIARIAAAAGRDGFLAVRGGAQKAARVRGVRVSGSVLVVAVSGGSSENAGPDRPLDGGTALAVTQAETHVGPDRNPRKSRRVRRVALGLESCHRPFPWGRGLAGNPADGTYMAERGRGVKRGKRTGRLNLWETSRLIARWRSLRPIGMALNPEAELLPERQREK